MEMILFKFIGESPLLMHNVRLGNPLDAYKLAIDSHTGKGKKTIEDIKRLARIEWEGGLYLENGIVALPMRMIAKTMERGATKQKKGTQWKTGCVVMDDYCNLIYPGQQIIKNGNGEIPDPELDQFYTEEHVDQRMVSVQRNKILRTRPIFHKWSLEAAIAYNPEVINKETLIQCAIDAGRLCGFGDYRIEKGGGFGRFAVEVIED